MLCNKTKKKRQSKATAPSLNILLSNGRFPVSIDLARQLKFAGHNVFVVDPMHYHVCRFSRAVRKSFWAPAPHVDAAGYVDCVRRAVEEAKIDLIIPMHEEIFHLAELADEAILKRLFSFPFTTLIRLHNKWEFSKFLGKVGLDAPKAWLCRSMTDVYNLPLGSTELALKPVYGRAATNVHHLYPDKPLPSGITISDTNHYIAQEWITGERFCSYSVFRGGRVYAFAVYPVVDTIDGASCVYFQSVDHPRIRAYVERLAAALPDVSGQLALDLIETEDRLVAIECNPRATSGIHLWSGKTDLARAFTESYPAVVKPGARRQVIPGMLMWSGEGAGPGEYVRHMKRLMGTKDVLFSKRDILPSLMQPFLLTSYYEICRERKMDIPTMFQWDLVWEPDAEQLRRVQRLLDAEDEDAESRITEKDAGDSGLGSDVIGP